MLEVMYAWIGFNQDAATVLVHEQSLDSSDKKEPLSPKMLKVHAML